MDKAFIKYVYRTFCKFEENADKVNEIEKTVKSVLNKLLEKFEKRFPNLAISKIVGGGSFYEQTKVGSPNEFDYMVVIKKLSLPGTIQVVDGCFPWFSKIYLRKQNGEYADLSEQGYLRNELVTNRFWSKLLVLCQIEEISETMKYGTIRTIGCKNRKLTLQYVESKSYENKSTTEDISQENSQALVSLTTIDIGVDLMLAIEYPNLEEIITMKGFPREFKGLVENNGCHLVAKSCQSSAPCTKCWHVSLASSESQLMREMDEKHKQCYQVLKYLLTREVPFSGKCANLSSYMLKNAFLFHVYGGGGCKNDISGCVYDVLDYLQNNFRRCRMPCFLSRNIDTWGSVYKFPVFTNLYDSHESKYHDDGSFGEEWYGLCWLELWRRVVKKASRLLKSVTTANDGKILQEFNLMRESMKTLIECYCKFKNRRQSPSEVISLPSDVSDSEIDEKFKFYFGKLQEMFAVKLGNLLEE